MAHFSRKTLIVALLLLSVLSFVLALFWTKQRASFLPEDPHTIVFRAKEQIAKRVCSSNLCIYFDGSSQALEIRRGQRQIGFAAIRNDLATTACFQTRVRCIDTDNCATVRFSDYLDGTAGWFQNLPAYWELYGGELRIEMLTVEIGPGVPSGSYSVQVEIERSRGSCDETGQLRALQPYAVQSFVIVVA